MDKKNGLFIDEDKVLKILTEGVTQTDLKETKHELLTQIKQVKQTLDEVSIRITMVFGQGLLEYIA